MSDFLSKFSGSNYDELLEKDKQQNSLEKEQVEKQRKTSTDQVKEETPTRSKARAEEKTLRQRRTGEKEKPPVQSATRRERQELLDEDYEIDPSYQMKKKRKRLIWIGSGIILFLLLLFFVYRFTHVTLPNFVGQSVSEVRAWGVRNNVEFSLKQEFNLKHDVNEVISQKTKANQSVQKGSTVTLVVSKGADPDEVVPLPDFSTMTADEAESWIDSKKMENLQLTRQFSDTVANNKFIRLDITTAGVTKQEYKRKDNAIVYYSRGKEVLEKNIEVPNFAGKTKGDVETWAKANSIEMTYTDQANESIAIGSIISQSIEAGQKVAKKDKMGVFVSAGKGVTVPDFSGISPSQAAESASGLTVTVKYQLSETIGYGTLLSQSIEAGKQLSEKDNKNITLIYSQGAPYLKDLRGKNASEIPKYFFEEFQSRGADITYETYWVDSDQPKGTIAEMSEYETTIPLSYHVYIGISNGSKFVGIPPQQQNPPASDDNTLPSGKKQEER